MHLRAAIWDERNFMEEEVKKVGQLFKGKREEKNLSLKEVENTTSIRVNYLEAIEEGRICLLYTSPSPRD